MKFVGMIIVVLSGALAGISVSEKYSKRVKFLRSYIDLLMHLKSEISYSEKTILEILKNYCCDSFLKSKLNLCLKEAKTKSLKDSWEYVFSNINSETGITKEENSLIVNFGQELGNYSISEQINHINHYLGLFNIHIRDAEDQFKNKSKLPIIMGICLSFAAGLMFI